MPTFVTRPPVQMTAGRPTRYPYAEVRQTLVNGKAFPLKAKTRQAAQRAVEAMRRSFRPEGLRLGRVFIKDGVLLWVERAARKDGTP